MNDAEPLVQRLIDLDNGQGAPLDPAAPGASQAGKDELLLSLVQEPMASAEGLRSVTINGKQFAVRKVYCCREWIVLSATGVGKCGYCGQQPT